MNLSTSSRLSIAAAALSLSLLASPAALARDVGFVCQAGTNDIPALFPDGLCTSAVVCGDYIGARDVAGLVMAAGRLSPEVGFSIGRGAPDGIDGAVVWAGAVTAESGTFGGNVATLGLDDHLGPNDGDTVTFDGNGTRYTNPELRDVFQTQCASAEDVSLALCAAANTGAAGVIPNSGWWGEVTVTITQAGANVFAVDSQDLTGAVNIRVVGDPGFPSAQAVVNVVGDATHPALAFERGQVELSDIDESALLFNFCGITDLRIWAYGLRGSLLAPFAHLDFSAGSVDGALVVRSLTGDAELHCATFAGGLTVNSTCDAQAPQGAPGLPLWCDGSKGLEEIAGVCACPAGMVDNDKGCVCDAAGHFVAGADGVCACDAANGFADDGNGACAAPACPVADKFLAVPYYVNDGDDLAELATYTVISGDIVFGGGAELGAVALPCLRDFSGKFKVEGTRITSLSVGGDVTGDVDFGGTLTVVGNANLVSVDLGSVTSMNGTVRIDHNCLLTATGVVASALPADTVIADNDGTACGEVGTCTGCFNGVGNGTATCQRADTQCEGFYVGSACPAYASRCFAAPAGDPDVPAPAHDCGALCLYNSGIRNAPPLPASTCITANGICYGYENPSTETCYGGTSRCP